MLGVAHILDDEGNELPAGEIGTVWFSGGYDFDYHNDPQKTAEAKDAAGYSTVGDVGYLDAEGYLYLTDRKAFMIISGGVNIYPQEAENVLINHPKVLDVGVIGVPDPEMGEAVKAVVQPVRWEDAGPELRGRAHLVLPRAARRLQVPPLGRLRRGAAPPRHRQALQAAAPRQVLVPIDPAESVYIVNYMTDRLCEGRVAIVTGAGRGIGREYALMLAEHGAKVVVNDLGGARDGSGGDVGPAQEVVDEIVAAGGEAVANTDDVSSLAVPGLVRQAIETFGGLDVLVNNAGILRDRMVFSMAEEEWDAVIKVHLKGTFAPTRFAAEYWRNRAKAGEPNDARIINTTSVSGLYANPGQTNYGAAKAGIAAFTQIAAQELGRYGVTVNAIAPGALTRLTEDLELPDEVTSRFEPRWVAPVVTWLASPLSADVTGQVIESSGLVLAIAEGWHRGPSTDDPPAERPRSTRSCASCLPTPGPARRWPTSARPWSRATSSTRARAASPSSRSTGRRRGTPSPTRCSTSCSTRSPAPTPTTTSERVVVTGAGDFFSAGTDLSAGAGGYDADATGFKPLRGGTRDVGGELALRIFGSTKPVIAAINGTAVGIGVTMILPMDVRIGAEGARFGLPFTRRGIVPESCATWFLPRIVGIATAVDWAVTGRIFGADEALAAGLVRELRAGRPGARPGPRGRRRDRRAAPRRSRSRSPASCCGASSASPHPMSANRLESKALLALGAMPDATEGVAVVQGEAAAPRSRSTVPGDLPAFYPWWTEEPFDG